MSTMRSDRKTTGTSDGLARDNRSVPKRLGSLLICQRTSAVRKFQTLTTVMMKSLKSFPPLSLSRQTTRILRKCKPSCLQHTKIVAKLTRWVLTQWLSFLLHSMKGLPRKLWTRTRTMKKSRGSQQASNKGKGSARVTQIKRQIL